MNDPSFNINKTHVFDFSDSFARLVSKRISVAINLS